MVIPELKVGNILGNFWQGKPKNATSNIKFFDRSLDFQLDVKTKNNIIDYSHIVKKLPGEIRPDDCIIKTYRPFSGYLMPNPVILFYNRKVVLILVKAEEESWEATLASTGLDME